MRSTAGRPRVTIVGGPDVDARLDLMHHLAGAFDVSALGSSADLAGKFGAEGFAYRSYRLSRRPDPVTDLASLGQLVLAFRQLQPQVVHAFDTKPGVWGCLAARLAGVPCVAGTVTGLGSLYGGNGLATRASRALYEALQSLACRVSDATVFQNGADRRYFVAAGIVPPERALVIPGSGVRTDVFAPGRTSSQETDRLRRELGIAPDALVVTMVSRVIRSKGVLDLAAAARALRASHPHVRFLLVGPADDGSQDRLSAGDLSLLRESVVWPGPRDDVPALLAASDVFVLPSAYREGVPRVLLEAASMGLPLVTTDSPGCSDVVEDGLNGILVLPRDPGALARAIVRLIDDPSLRHRFGQASRQRALARFDLSVIAADTIRLYQRLLARSARPRSRTQERKVGGA